MHHGGSMPMTANRGAVGLAEISPSRPMAGAPRPVASAPAPSRRAPPTEHPPTEAPAQSEAGGVVFTLLRREECHIVEALRPQGRLAPIWTTRATDNPVPSAERKGASERAFEQALATLPRPSAEAGEEAEPGAPAATATTPALWRWCPLHETCIHDMMGCRCLNSMVENYKKRFVECWCVALTSSWEPQEEGMMSTTVSFPSVRNQGLIDQLEKETTSKG
jgi:hypothetical protein